MPAPAPVQHQHRPHLADVYHHESKATEDIYYAATNHGELVAIRVPKPTPTSVATPAPALASKPILPLPYEPVLEDPYQDASTRHESGGM